MILRFKIKETPFIRIGNDLYLIDRNDYEKYKGSENMEWEFQIVNKFIDRKGQEVKVIKITPHNHTFSYKPYDNYRHQKKCEICGYEKEEEHYYQVKKVNDKIYSHCEVCGYTMKGAIDKWLLKYIKNQTNYENLSEEPEEFIKSAPEVIEKINEIIQQSTFEETWTKKYYKCPICNYTSEDDFYVRRCIVKHLEEEWKNKIEDKDIVEWIVRLEHAFEMGFIKEKEFLLEICPICKGEYEKVDVRHIESHLKGEIIKKLNKLIPREKLDIALKNQIIEIILFVADFKYDKYNLKEYVKKMSIDEINREIKKLEENRYEKYTKEVIEEVPIVVRYEEYGVAYYYQVGTREVRKEVEKIRDTLQGNSYYYLLVYHKLIREILSEEEAKLLNEIIEDYKSIRETAEKILKEAKIETVIRISEETRIKRKIERLSPEEKNKLEQLKLEYYSLQDKAKSLVQEAYIINKKVDIIGKSVIKDVVVQIIWKIERIKKKLNEDVDITSEIYKFLKLKGLIEKERREVKPDPYVSYDWVYHYIYVKGKEYNLDYIRDKELIEMGVKEEFDRYIEEVRRKTRERNKELLQKVIKIEQEINNIIYKNKL